MLEYLAVIGMLSAQDGSGAASCQLIADDARRLACYDQVFGRPGEGASVPAAAAAPTPAAAAPPSQAAAAPPQAAPPAEEFGLSEEQRNQKKQDPAPVIQRIESHVVAIERLPRDRFTLTLENGQKWTLLEPTPMPRFHVGELITIRKAALNSFLALGPSAGTGVRVRRLD